MTADNKIDASQLAVVSADVIARQIVIAGPGAGKTEVVGRLAERLVADGVLPEEILVISFSRAAVAATRQRTADVVDRGHGIDLVTIDSLAGRIVSDDDVTAPAGPAGGRVRSRGFDAIVDRAMAVLVARGWIGEPVAHLIIDEVQDVVGLRARFVLTLLDVLTAAGAGFTLLGDPLQGVYDFQLGSETMTCTDLLAAVRTRFDPIDRSLSGKYRSRFGQAAAAATDRAALTGLRPGPLLSRLRALEVDLPPLGELDADAAADINAWVGTTALLCDTNIRAALTADRLSALGVPVETARGTRDRSLDPWIAALLQDRPESVLTREEFLMLAADAENVGSSRAAAVDWVGRWRTLLNATRGRRTLSLADLGAALSSPSPTRDLERSVLARVVASTIHRSKGLEYDNVVLVDPDRWDHPQRHDLPTRSHAATAITAVGATEDDAAEASGRRLFVALTRARTRLTRVRGIDPRGWARHDRDDMRMWIRRPPRRGRRTRPDAVLLEPWMARTERPAAALATFNDAPDRAAATSQDWRSRISWVRDHDLITVDGDVLPSWTAHLNQSPVARTTEEFGRILAALTDPALARLPHLTGGRLEGLETVTGPPSPVGVGRFGFWTGGRIGGIIELTYGTKEST